MKRIIFAALILTFVTGGAFSAPKSKKATALKQPSAKQAVVSSVPLSSLFPVATEESAVVEAKGMVSMAAPNHEVVIVRINADGTRSHACVDNETAARAFMANQKNAAATAAKQAQ